MKSHLLKIRPLKICYRFTHWLETRWIAPSYSGWLMGGLSLFFFGAATNTMSGWLYVMSGVMLALLAIAAFLPERSLRGIRVYRQPIQAVSVGEELTLELALENQTNQSKTLIQVQDLLPADLSQPLKRAIEVIPAHKTERWVYQVPTQQRGVYRWQTVQLRTAAPLGLFWCQRSQAVNATAIVYPIVLPLSRCPLIDEMGQNPNTQSLSHYQSHAAPEGLTRTLRPYRWGDSTRLIHWRTSARYGELRVRELEAYTGGQELVVALDSANFPPNLSQRAYTQNANTQNIGTQNIDNFEQAVVAAASLYFYARRHSLRVSLWTAATGLLRGNLGGDRVVLEALAAIQINEASQTDHLPNLPLLWLSQNPESLNSLPAGSRWLLWLPAQRQPELSRRTSINSEYPGLIIDPDQPLQLQLQSSLGVV